MSQLPREVTKPVQLDRSGFKQILLTADIMNP